MTVLDSAKSAALERLIVRDPGDVERVLPIDDRQRELTERYIVPNLSLLEEEFLAIRETVDANIRRRLEEAEAPGAPSEYPKGFCLPITLEAVSQFEKRSASGHSTATAAVSAFRREGGHVTKIWGVLRNQYFQNALQLGSFYFDVANDTVDVNKPKVEYMPMAESGFRNVETYAEFADVAERYWQCEIYPNLHFPRLAPLLPLIKISPADELSLESFIYYLQRMNVDSGFRAGEMFVTSSHWTDKRLPDEWLERIQHYKSKHFSAHARTPRAGVDPADVARLCAEYRATASYTSRLFLTRVFHSAVTLSIGAR